jgi:hypothetical protein
MIFFLYFGIVLCSFMPSCILLSTELLFYVLLRCTILFYIVRCCPDVFCFCIRCCLVTCYFHCVMLLSIVLWLGLNVFDKLTVHQKSHRWTKFRNLHIVKEILDSNQKVVLTRRDKYILEILRWPHSIKYRTLTDILLKEEGNDLSRT